MIKTYKLPETFYPVSIHVVVADNWIEVNKKYDTTCDDSLCATTFSYNGNQLYLTFIRGRYQVKHITHELVHIINSIYLYIGATHDLDNDEHYAYLMGWLFDECYKFIAKHV